jgi:hypothetical protein
MRVGITGHRFARRLKRCLLDALDRRDLRPTGYEHGLEQHERLAALLAADAVALLERRRSDSARALVSCRKGKLGKPTEFGYVAQICEVTENGRKRARGSSCRPARHRAPSSA